MDPAANTQEVVIDPFSRSEPRALINIVGESLETAILTAHAARPELFGLPEAELYDKLYMENKEPNGVDNALRMRFWFEYDEAQNEKRKLKIKNIWTGVCEDMAFYGALKKPHKVAWLITRPLDYEIATAELHQFTLAQLRKIVSTPLVVNGKYNASAAKDKIEIFKLLDQRVKGAVVQKTLNVHSSLVGKANALSEEARREDVERRIKELERATDKQQGKIIDTRVITVE